ncbi:MAG: beta-N-acetylhexosaminidase [Bacteriovoracaceae bacterium]
MNSSIGQLLITGIEGTTLSKEEKEFIEAEDIGGVLLFTRNYESPAQLAELVNEIQKCRKEYPLFIAVDHEGGRVIRFKKDFIQLPSALDLAGLASPKIIFHVTKIMAQELGACGINLNLAPVCDVFTNEKNKVIGDRAYGRSEEEVSLYVSSVVRGLQTNGIIACAKHFPGHGSTLKDSHFDLPYVHESLEEIEKIHIPPFLKAIKSRVEFVMMAHLQVDAIDDQYPVSLSEKAHHYLRKELRFNKLIISDDMQMGAILKKYSIEDASLRALQAGSDVLEFRDFENTVKVVERLKKALQEKELTSDRLKAKLDRVREVKKTYLSEYRPIYIPEISKNVGLKANQIFVDELMEKIQGLAKPA